MMHRDLGGTAFEPAEKSSDRELTLGPMSLVAAAVVLCAICAACFLWGYSAGHRGAAVPAEQQASASSTAALQPVRAPAKPTASQNSALPEADGQTGEPAAAATPEAAEDNPEPASPETGATAKVRPTATGGPSMVQTALPGQEAAMKLATSGTVQPALPQAGQWMVQIAAVTHQEDADVLVSALRKRGYAVSTRRDPTDNLLHVQVGPFTSHADAASMRERLLGDGYNALIEP